MADKNVREELAELTEAVRELRDREVADELRSLRAEVEHLRAERSSDHCHGCHCMHINWYPYTPVTTTGAWTSQPYTVTCGTSSVTATNAIGN